MKYSDTIVARATAAGAGAIGIVRISGSAARSILHEIVVPHRPGPWRSRHVRYGHVQAVDGSIIDEVLAFWMRGPTSYTGEDVVEISCHGGAVAVELVVARCVAAGARLAFPGEFTMRAYQAGRIDLSQAEAVMDVIQAQTPQALAQAHQQLQGWVGTAVKELRTAVLYELAAVIARIDFPDDVAEELLDTAALKRVLQRIDDYLASARTGVLLRDGAQIALLGRPNVGKSSLLNALLRYDRALVSAVAGTTRDTVEESADIGGIPVRFVDTAGIRAHTEDAIEQMGITRSHQVAKHADLALVLIDGSQPLSDADRLVIAARAVAPALLVITKSDLPLHPGVLPALEPYRTDGNVIAEVHISTVNGEGIDDLRSAIATALRGTAPASDQRISNTRHLDALQRARVAIGDALSGAHAHVAAELIAIDLQEAVNAFAEITGEDATEALLDVVFARFCIGK